MKIGYRMYSMRQQIHGCLRPVMQQNMYRLRRHPCRGKRWKLHQCNSMMRAELT